MLKIDLRRLPDGGTETRGSLAPDDPVLAGLELEFAGPVEVTGTLTPTADGDFVWRGHIVAEAVGECRRCLGDATQMIDDEVDVIFSSNPELDEDPSVYELPADALELDVSQAVREEIALRVSKFPLCREDCRGICSGCGADLNAGPCQCADSGSTS